MLKHCVDRYNTQEMCGKAVGACLSAFKFVTNKMLEKLGNPVFYDYIIFANVDFNNNTFFCGDMSIVNVDFNLLQDGPFLFGLLTDGRGPKRPHSLKSVRHILQ